MKQINIFLFYFLSGHRSKWRVDSRSSKQHHPYAIAL